MPARNAIAIDLGRRWLRAIHATRSRQRLRVRRIVSEPLPEDLAADDPNAVGAWVGRTLSEASFPKGRATIAIAREHVALKRITLPTIDAQELPEMTRLALRRELPFDPDSAVIDFVVLDQTANSTTVLAVAAPKARVAYLRDISLLQVTARVAANAPPDEMEAEEELPDPQLDPWPDDEAGLASADSMGGEDLDDASASADAANDPETVASSPVEEPGRRIGRWLRGD